MEAKTKFLQQLKNKVESSTNPEADKEIAILIENDNLYELGEPTSIDDKEYDSLRKSLKEKYPDHPYFDKVGSEVGQLEKVTLPNKMGSLNQIYEGEFDTWIKKYDAQNLSINISDKLDGISSQIIYKDGKLLTGFSRGNGIVGQDITRHINGVTNIPRELEDGADLEIRGELIMKTRVFDEKYSSLYKHPRSMVAGLFNRKQPKFDVLLDVKFIAYQIIKKDGKEMSSKAEELGMLMDYDFDIVKNTYYDASILNDDYMIEILETAKRESDYYLDGIVLSINDYSSVDNLSNSSSLNPEHTVKFKCLDEDAIATTTVKDIHYNLSKSGFFKGIVELEPVDLFGTTVTFCTGKNGKYIVDNKIGKGAVVTITKAGTVIPEILSVVSPKEDNVSNTPDGDWKWNDTGVEFMATDMDHPEIVFKNVLFFFEKLDVDNLKEASLRTIIDELNLVNDTYESIITSLMDLSSFEWKSIIGANGTKIYNSLHRRLQNLNYEILLGATKYLGFGLGVTKAKNLIKNLNDPEDVWDLQVEDIVTFDGFHEKTATRIVEGLPLLKDFRDSIENYITLHQEEVSSELNDINVVMTGFRDNDLKSLIESKGGNVKTSVSKKTTYLLTIDVNSTSGKAKKARDNGVEIMTPEAFKDLYNL